MAAVAERRRFLTRLDAALGQVTAGKPVATVLAQDGEDAVALRRC